MSRFLLLLATAALAHAEGPPQFAWARRSGGGSDDRALAVAVDTNANVLVTGFFTGSVQIGSSNFVSAGLEDMFVAKFDSAGTFLWARQAGGTGDDFGLGVAADAGGNVYVTGSYQNTATFSPTNSLTAAGNGPTRASDIFVAKYSPAGTLLWVSSAGGKGSDQANAIALDAQGNAFVTGSFDADASFGTNSLANNTGADDVFVAKCSNTGTFLWSRKAGDSGTNNLGNGIAVDGAANVYVTGYFGGTAAFGATNLTSNGGNSVPDMFLAKYDAAGTLLWVRQAGGTGDDRGIAVAADAPGNVSVTGQFVGSAAFGSSNLVANGNGPDIFVARYAPDGTVLWLRRAGGSNVIYGDSGFGVALDAATNTLVSGYFSGTATFGGINLVSAGFQNIFCSKYDPAGNLLWARSAGGSLNDFGLAVASNPLGDAFLAGFFTSSTVAFDGITLTNSGGRDLFLARLGLTISLPPSPMLQVTLSNNQVVLTWPTAAAGFSLEQTAELPATDWQPVTNSVSSVGTNNQVLICPEAGSSFYRLRYP